jgi:hypothetical protein
LNEKNDCSGFWFWFIFAMLMLVGYLASVAIDHVNQQRQIQHVERVG